MVFLRKSREIERKTRRFGGTLEEKLGFGKDLEEGKWELTNSLEAFHVVSTKNALKSALISPPKPKQLTIRNPPINR